MPEVGAWVSLSGKESWKRRRKAEWAEVAACETLSLKEEAKDP